MQREGGRECNILREKGSKVLVIYPYDYVFYPSLSLLKIRRFLSAN
jgi:hypothetical protein